MATLVTLVTVAAVVVLLLELVTANKKTLNSCFFSPDEHCDHDRFESLRMPSSEAPNKLHVDQQSCTSALKKNSNLCSELNLLQRRQRSAGDHHTLQAAMTSSLALVPYDEAHILPHQKASREFTLDGHTYTIQQDWNKLGVAAVVWDSAVVLAEYLIQNKGLVQGKNVLELGAGTGLTGMVAASLGAHVTVTERAEALDHLKSIVDDNTSGKSWDISSKVLDWTNDLNKSGFATPDVILGADIVYIEETFQDLLRTIMGLAKTKHTAVLLSCKIRYDRDLHFLSLLGEHFDVKEVLYEKARDIKIFSVQRKS